MIFYIFYIILIFLAIFLATKISIADMRHRIIPDIYLFPLMLIGLCFTTFFPYPITTSDGVIGAVFGYITTALIGFIFQQFVHKHKTYAHPAIGMGDIKLISVGGIWLGIYGLSIALIISCVCGAIWAHFNHARYIPFAPFFIFGGFLSFIGLFFLL